MEDLLLMKDMTDSQRMMFQSRYTVEQKNVTVGVLLALFLGDFGAHRFYMGNVGLGVVYLLFFWTFIPAVIAFVEVFMMSARVRRYNQQKATEIALVVKSMT